MYLFILKADRSVVVEETVGQQADYIAACVPKGQLFIKADIAWCDGWRCLHRSGAITGNTWKAAPKVPEEVKLAEMIVN
jgi:hypothetical protein